MTAEDRIRLEIVTPDKEVFHAMVEEFYFPALAGETGVLFNHAPLVSVLVPGVLRYKRDGVAGKIAVGRGFLELHDNEAEILVASAEPAASIDVARANAARQRAEQRLAQAGEEVDRVRAKASLARAMARLKAAE